MENFFRNWNFMRLLRLAMGIFIVVQGILYNQWFFVVIGAVFSLMPLFNVGCCTTNCATNRYDGKGKDDEVIFEEIKVKKD